MNPAIWEQITGFIQRIWTIRVNSHHSWFPNPAVDIVAHGSVVSSIVTGPLLWISTSIIAPNTPVAT